MESPVWRPEPETRVALPELCIMHGGPIGMYLPEHEHSEIQISMHFIANRHTEGHLVGKTPSSFTLIPPGKPHTGRWSDGDEVVVALLPSVHMERTADEVLRRPSVIVSASCVIDPVIAAIGYSLHREFLARDITDPLYLEAIGVVLAGHIARHWTSTPHAYALRGQLSTKQLRTALSAIEETLKHGISISVLASYLGMGTHQFTRLFRRSTGLSPYQFILRRRLERARVLLKSTAMPLTAIALDLGFASHSHFGSVFRQHFGITPKAFRMSCSSRGCEIA